MQRLVFDTIRVRLRDASYNNISDKIVAGKLVDGSAYLQACAFLIKRKEDYYYLYYEKILRYF